MPYVLKAYQWGTRYVCAWATGRGQAIAPTMLRVGHQFVLSRGTLSWGQVYGLSSPCSDSQQKYDAYLYQCHIHQYVPLLLRIAHVLRRLNNYYYRYPYSWSHQDG